VAPSEGTRVTSGAVMSLRSLALGAIVFVWPATASHLAPAKMSRRAATVGSLSLLCARHCARAESAADSSLAGVTVGQRVLDTLGYLPAPEVERLDRILGTLQSQTGFKVRVLTGSRRSADWERTSWEARGTLGIGAGSGAGLDPNAVLVVADRGIKGALEAGSSFITFEVGDNVRLVLPDVFWGKLQREYGRRKFVEARGETASIVVTCELILSCLRLEDFCVSVPSPDASYF